MGFLHGKPEKWSKPNRLASYRDAGETPPIPDFNGGSHLWDVFEASGMAANDGFGARALPWSEIVALAAIERLTGEEAKVLRQMSAAYVDGLAVGNDIFGIPPWEQHDD